MKYRLNIIFIFIIILMGTLLSRVYFLSIKSNTYYEELSKRNYIHRVLKAPIRGVIEDRNGEKLAVNQMGFSILIEPHLASYKNKKKLQDAIALISKHFPAFEEKELMKIYRRKDSPYNHDYVPIIDYIPYDEFFPKYTLIASQDNVKIESAVKRHYPYRKVASHIIGYVGKASKNDIINQELEAHHKIIGKNGLEKYYNEILQGKVGYKDVKVNALNEEIEILEEQEPSSDNNIKISLDIKLQKYIQDIFGKKSGAVIVMDAHNGEILAGASFPEFDNNIFAEGISTKEWEKMRNDFNHPFTNKLINGLYPPGSVIKMGIALSFLENGLSKDYKVYDNGSHRVGNRNFRCWKTTGHGTVGFIKAIRESCDDFFYKASMEIGIDNISNTLDKLGFGQKTGVDQLNEFVGINPNKDWKQKRFNQPWYVGETLISSIGQGNVLVTPMQMARYTGYLATGKLPKPHLYKLNYEEPTEVDIPKEFLPIVRKGMYEVTYHPDGTAKRHIKSEIAIASKTGTAQVITIPQSEKKRMKESELDYYQRSHAWLTTYAPYRDPKYVVTVIVEHGGHGGSAAGGIVSKIYNKLEELGYIKRRGK
ncbi:penicillin-binding protein 2 [Poseidonibacter sp.]|uniref:penicillin-binding protein 2 n=1 Tax=Poseidonibacter sp. TaxID=2321188 RepID=UPI003C71AD65